MQFKAMALGLFLLSIIFFSQEFIQTLKKIMKKPLLRLFLPLLLVSEALLHMERGVIYILQHLQLALIYLSQALSGLFPKNVASEAITEAVYICILALLIPWILEFQNWKKMHIVFPNIPSLAAILWIFWAILCLLMN